MKVGALVICGGVVASAGTIPQVLEEEHAGQTLNILFSGLMAGDLIDTLEGAGPFTVFAPTNDAFLKLGEQTIRDLLKPEGKAKLVDMLEFHVVNMFGTNLPALLSKDVDYFYQSSLDTIRNCSYEVERGYPACSSLSVFRDSSGLPHTACQRCLSVGQDRQHVSNVVIPDIVASNGVIHVIDGVLMPLVASDPAGREHVQCGGTCCGWKGPTECNPGLHCDYKNEHFSDCVRTYPPAVV